MYACHTYTSEPALECRSNYCSVELFPDRTKDIDKYNLVGRSASHVMAIKMNISKNSFGTLIWFLIRS